MKSRLTKALQDPAQHDPVYQACQRIFHRQSSVVLTRENPVRRSIRTRALRRFLHGCPPRKKNDTSFGDALNWEWMIECANAANAELVIVSRDSDYGAVFEGKAYVNDHLRHEFSERVSKKRKLLLYTRLSEALKHFAVTVSQQEEQAETELVNTAAQKAPVDGALVQITGGSLAGIVGRLRADSPAGRAIVDVLLSGGQTVTIDANASDVRQLPG